MQSAEVSRCKRRFRALPEQHAEDCVRLERCGFLLASYTWKRCRVVRVEITKSCRRTSQSIFRAAFAECDAAKNDTKTRSEVMQLIGRASRHTVRHAPHSPAKLPLPVGRSPPPSTCLILGPSRSIIPNGIRIQSAVFPQYTGQTDRQSDTNRPDKWDRRHRLYEYSRIRSVDYSDATDNEKETKKQSGRSTL